MGGELYDAERVDPQILETERAGDVDRVAEGLCKLVLWDRGHKVFESVFLELYEVDRSPAVA